MAKRVVTVYGGEIPMDEKELVTLAGVRTKNSKCGDDRIHRSQPHGS